MSLLIYLFRCIWWSWLLGHICGVCKAHEPQLVVPNHSVQPLIAACHFGRCSAVLLQVHVHVCGGLRNFFFLHICQPALYSVLFDKIWLDLFWTVEGRKMTGWRSYQGEWVELAEINLVVVAPGNRLLHLLSLARKEVGLMLWWGQLKRPLFWPTSRPSSSLRQLQCLKIFAALFWHKCGCFIFHKESVVNGLAIFIGKYFGGWGGAVFIS